MHMKSGRTNGVYKEGRPVSFMFVPSAGYKWQIQNTVPAVWCARFDGSAIEDFLERASLHDQGSNGEGVCDRRFLQWKGASGPDVEPDKVSRGFLQAVQSNAPSRDRGRGRECPVWAPVCSNRVEVVGTRDDEGG